MIEVRDLRKSFGSTQAVRSLSFSVPTGHTLVLLGPSGCGKTTTLRMLNRLLEPDAGEIVVDGQSASELPAVQWRRRMGYVIQRSGLFPHLTILENIATVPRLLGWDKMRIRERAEFLLARLDLDPQQHLPRYPAQLSGGQQQRVGIARALAADPPILLMDEPFGALDPVTRRQIRQDFLELEELRDKTVVMVTHDVSEAFDMGDQIALLNAGAIQELASPAVLLHSQDDFVRAFLAGNRWELEMNLLTWSDLAPHWPGPRPNNWPPKQSLRDLWESFDHESAQPEGLRQQLLLALAQYHQPPASS